MSINSKITLKVKSGPGEIAGETELELNENSVDFSKIQFTEPGDYVISVIPSNDSELEQTEFSISIEDEEEVIPQENSGDVEEESQPIDGTRPIIAQISQPSIKLDSMEFDKSNSDKDNEEIGSTLGFTPFIWYNGTQIRTSDIIKFFLYYEDLVPKCRMTIKDSQGFINSPETTPLNDTKFEIFLNSNSEVLKSIHLKFKLELNKLNKNGTNTITGTIDIPEFYKRIYSSYNDTSFNTFKKMSKELQLGYNSNITNTDDKMKWRRKGTNYQESIKNITKHSYISDDSFLMSYIDFYWCFNYVDLEKEWKRDISKDVGIVSQGVTSLGKEEVSSMILTNDPSNNSSPFYFTNAKLSNNSTQKKINRGIFSVSKVYDRKKKQFLKFNIDSLSSEGDDKIILKGAPGDSDSLDTDFTNDYGGKIDTDNVHKNYFYAKEQNRRNLDNLVNISISITLPQPNYNLYLYQKVYMAYINQKQTVTDQKILDERLSGDWMIIDISFNWILGSLIQKVLLVRKELGKTKKENLEQEVGPKSEVNNSEINENPIDAETTDTNGAELEGFDFGDEIVEEDLITDEFNEVEFDGLSEEEYEIQEEIADAQEDSTTTGDLGAPVDIQPVTDFDSLLKLAGKLARELGKNARVRYENLNKGYERGTHGLCPQGTQVVLAAITGVKQLGKIPGNADWFSFKTPGTGGYNSSFSDSGYYNDKVRINQVNNSWKGTYLQDSSQWQVGDIVAMGYLNGKKYGHIQIWTGVKWMSDFKQNAIQQRNVDPNTVALWRLSQKGLDALNKQSSRLA